MSVLQRLADVARTARADRIRIKRDALAIEFAALAALVREHGLAPGDVPALVRLWNPDLYPPHGLSIETVLDRLAQISGDDQ